MYLCQGIAPRWLLLPISLVLQVSLFTATVKSYTPLSDNSLKLIPAPGADFDIKTGSILAPILQTRVPGTPGSLAVQSHFLEFFQNQLPLWKVDYQNSTAKTPATGDRDVPFANIIATRDPPWASPGDVGRLALVAHYDSKLTPEGFIGAIDSAAPCAMILHAARSVDSALTRKWSAMAAQGADTGLQEEVGVQILLLDGEEAFINWSATDSLYGARSLAEEWESTHHHPTSTYRTAISSINLFFLLDLLGSANPSIPSFFVTTHWAYKKFATVESRMRALSLLKSNPTHAFLPDHDKAINTFGRGFVEDDHIPFIARGVEILHIIPLPFPGVWHTIRDDGEHLDMPTTSDWAVIVTGFLAEWMDLEGFLEEPVKARDVVEKDAVTSKTEL